MAFDTGNIHKFRGKTIKDIDANIDIDEDHSAEYVDKSTRSDWTGHITTSNPNKISDQFKTCSVNPTPSKTNKKDYLRIAGDKTAF